MKKPGRTQRIAIVGAGLVGSLLSIYLIRRGHKVSVYERRSDMRKENAEAGRSINLALSNRGIRALQEVGLAEELRNVAIPMNGRMMHDTRGTLTFQPYGKQGQFINSISRSDLNAVLMTAAEKEGAKFHFNHRCLTVDLTKTEITFQTPAVPHINTPTPQHTNTPAPPHLHTSTHPFDLIVGADGSYSAVRGSFQMADRFDYCQDYIAHGYQEFHIRPGEAGKFLLGKNALHIWPRESFMMIALPNPDGSFTCTLFFPWEGSLSFQSLTTGKSISDFFKANFPDITGLMADPVEVFQRRGPSSLLTVKCWPWVKNQTFLIGDAAHAIVPFYGQGMNAGFEDCRILNQLLNQFEDDWEKALREFQMLRKPDTDAIAQLALDNFVEMRDLVANQDFLLQKRIEARLHELYPDKWIPLYSMVTFHDQVRYSQAYENGRRQKEIMNKVMKVPGIAAQWESLNFQEIVNQL